MVMETGTFVEWLKKEGEHVNKGDPLFIISTDKATIEIESPADGILAGVKAKINDVIPVTEVIAYLLAPGEALPAKAAPQPVIAHCRAVHEPRPRLQWSRVAEPWLRPPSQARCAPLRWHGAWRMSWGWI